MVAILIREPFTIGLNNCVATLPKCRAHRVERITAFVCFRALQVLNRIDRLHRGQIILKPLNATFRLAILNVLDEIRDLILTGRTIHHWIALNQGNFNLVNP